MKPAAIKRFDGLYLGAVALSLLATVMDFDDLRAAMEAELALRGAQSATDAAIIVGLAVSAAFSLALWFLISVLRIGLLKWIAALFAAYGVVAFALAVGEITFDLAAILSLLVVLMNVAAVYFLFTPEAKAWFAAKRSDTSS